MERNNDVKCSCENLDPLFLVAIEAAIGRAGPADLKAKLNSLAMGCGYEKDQWGYWTQWPKQDAALGAMGFTSPRDYIVKRHDDGDATVKIAEELYVVTTDGEVFKQTD